MSMVLFYEAQARFPYNTTKGYDYLAWAKRINYRNERGDKTLTLMQIKNALDALNPKIPNVIF